MNRIFKNFGKFRTIIREKDFQMKWISQYRNEIYGLCTLWIMFYHGYLCGIDWRKYHLPFLTYGNIGVEVFLFLSGVCLFFSYNKKQDEYSFIKKRLSRVVPAVLSISGVYWILCYFRGDYDIWLTMLRFTTIDFLFTYMNMVWFASFIIVCYVLYPYIYGFFYSRDDKNLLLRTIVILILYCVFLLSLEKTAPKTYNGLEIALTRIPVFILGCACGKAVHDNKHLKNWPTLITSIAGIILCVYLKYHHVLSGSWDRLINIAMGLPLVFLSSYLIRFFNEQNVIRKIFRFFGKYSLELYLAHIMGYKVYTEWNLVTYKAGSLKRYLCLLLISILCACTMTKITDVIRLAYKKLARR